MLQAQVIEQYNEALVKHSLVGKKIFSTDIGLYGTSEGIEAYFGAFAKLREKVAVECNPQDVYNYEFNNHECEYVCCDSEAMKYVVSIFGMERAKTVKRRHGYISIEEIEEDAQE